MRTKIEKESFSLILVFIRLYHTTYLIVLFNNRYMVVKLI